MRDVPGRSLSPSPASVILRDRWLEASDSGRKATPDRVGEAARTEPASLAAVDEPPPPAELARGESGTPLAGGWWVVGTLLRLVCCAGRLGSDSLLRPTEREEEDAVSAAGSGARFEGTPGLAAGVTPLRSRGGTAAAAGRPAPLRAGLASGASAREGGGASASSREAVMRARGALAAGSGPAVARGAAVPAEGAPGGGTIESSLGSGGGTIESSLGSGGGIIESSLGSGGGTIESSLGSGGGTIESSLGREAPNPAAV